MNPSDRSHRSQRVPAAFPGTGQRKLPQGVPTVPPPRRGNGNIWGTLGTSENTPIWSRERLLVGNTP